MVDATTGTVIDPRPTCNGSSVIISRIDSSIYTSIIHTSKVPVQYE